MVSDNIKKKILNSGELDSDKKNTNQDSNKRFQAMQEELRKAYSLCLELEEENRVLQHEIMLMLKDILVKVNCG